GVGLARSPRQATASLGSTMEQNQLQMSASWTEIIATADDWNAADPHFLVSAFAQLVLIRAFEEYVLQLAAGGLVHGPAHSSIGQEGGAVGSGVGLAPRGQGHG